MAKNVVILGSTGSIGINTLKVIERFPNEFRVIGLTAYNNVELLEEQIKNFLPQYIAVNSKGFDYFRSKNIAKKIKILNVETDLADLVALSKVDIVVIAMRGSAALKPFLNAVRASKIVAPANKEALVVAGDIIMREARKHKAKIIPIDSEQSAIFQCLEGNERKAVKKIHLTASGGPLLDVPESKFDNLPIEKILQHPRWAMGQKITVDSATLMNKGFEVIEAKRLFDLNENEIDVVIHPEAIVHSMVEFQDGSIIAQLSATDMRLPIQYALTYPKRLKTNLKSLSFADLKQLTFRRPDLEKFPCLSLAFYAAEKGGTIPCVLNAADEEVVDMFLSGKIRFTDIFKIVEKVVGRHKNSKETSLSLILDADSWAREETQKIMRDSYGI